MLPNSLQNRRPMGETQAEVLDLLEKSGPLSRAQISEAVGRKCDSVLAGLLKRGCVEAWEEVNPLRNQPHARSVVMVYAFVSRDEMFKKGVAPSEETVRWCASVLSRVGYKLIPPDKDQKQRSDDPLKKLSQISDEMGEEL